MFPSRALPMSLMGRFYIYAIHGFAIEVLFTAGWEFVVNLNWKFPGNSSVWSFFIYGVSFLVIEQMFLYFSKKGVPLLVRALVYTLWTYLWEFSTGWVLKQLGACPWDYTPFHGDFMGLITLEYFPGWYLGNIISDLVLIPYVLNISWRAKDGMHSTTNGDVKHKNT